MKILTAALVVICATLAVLLVTHNNTTTRTVHQATTVATAGTMLNTTKIANSIQASILAQRQLHSVVSCPGREPQEAGVSFTCMAMTHRLRVPHTIVHTNFAVTVQNARGYATYIGR